MRIFTFLNFTLGLVFVQTGKPAPKSRHDHTRQPTFVLLMLQVSSGKQPRHLRNCGGHWGDRCENLSSSNSAILKGSCISGGEAGTAGAKERPNEMMPLGLFHLPVEPEPRAGPFVSETLLCGAVTPSQGRGHKHVRVLESFTLWEGQDVPEEWPWGNFSAPSAVCHGECWRKLC